MTGVEMFHKFLDQGEAGDNIGALLRGIDRKDVQTGQVLVQSPVRENLIPNLKHKYMCYQKKKAAAILHSLTDIVLSSTSVPPMLQALSKIPRRNRNGNAWG